VIAKFIHHGLFCPEILFLHALRRLYAGGKCTSSGNGCTVMFIQSQGNFHTSRLACLYVTETQIISAVRNTAE